MRTPAACAIALLALLAAARSEAQVARARGARLDPPAIDPSREVDPRGMSALVTARRRSPSGWLYPYPPEPWRGRDLGGGWLGGASISGGALLDGGDTSETRFGRYADWDDGFWLRWLDAQLLAPEHGWLARVAAGEVGRDDAFYRLELDRAGLLRLRASWSRIPLAYANDAQVLYDGAGSDTLTLPPGLVAGATPASALPPAFAAIADSVLSVQRDERRVELALRPREDLKLVARYGEDEREGARPFGGSLGYPAGTAASLVETVEPIDQITRTASAGLEWAREDVQASARYTLSVFRNRDDALSFDVPFAFDADVSRARFALAPDNLWQDVRGELAVALPWRGRFTGTVSWSRARQNDDLLPPTVNDGRVGGGPFGSVDLGQWSDSDARSRRHADAAIDQLLVDASLRAAPWRPLQLSARVRVLDHDDDTEYVAFNPLVGRIGYVGEDGALEAQTPQRRVFEPPRRLIEDFRYQSLPTSYRTSLGELRADWRAFAKTRVDASLEHEEIRREHRERDETREQRARVAVTSRDVEALTLRLSGEFAKRSGSSYDAFFLADTFVSSLPGYLAVPGSAAPYTLESLRMSDLASRTLRRGELRVHWLLRDDMDVAATASAADEDFPSDFGLSDERGFGASAEWSWQPSPRVNAFAWYGFERSERRQRSISDAALPGTLDGSAGGPAFPLTNLWRADGSERSHAASLGLSLRPHPRVTVESSYSFQSTETDVDYSFASAGALAAGTALDESGDGFPTLRLREHVVATQLRVQITAHVEAGVLHRFEHARLDDFHQTGLSPLVDPGSIFLGHEDATFTGQLVGAWLRFAY